MDFLLRDGSSDSRTDMESPTRGGSSPERMADPGSSRGAISPDASRLRDVVTFDHDSEVIDLSGCGLSDLKSLESCSRLSSLAVANNNLLSCDELCRLRRLWTLDLRGCGLTTVAPLVHLGALGELQLAHNRLLIGAALKLHPMALGRLGLQGNPLLPEGVRTAMRVRSGADEARLLRSFLADSLRVVALDDSFVTSAERKRRDYFDGMPLGRRCASCRWRQMEARATRRRPSPASSCARSAVLGTVEARGRARRLRAIA